MMALSLACWVMAMIGGFYWNRVIVMGFTGASVLSCLVAHPHVVRQGGGWIVLGMLAITPWLLSTQRARDQARRRRLQAAEATTLTRLQDLARSVLDLQAMTRRLESQIVHITELYHVTRETSRALHVDELVSFSLEIMPRLLDLRGLRLIERAESAEGAYHVVRALRLADGPLQLQPLAPIAPVEEEILQRAMTTGVSACAHATELSHPLPEEISRVAWAPLWSERQLIGVLIVDELPREQLGTLSVIANQLSLQLSRVRLYQAVESMAVTDTLTGLFVRRYFLEFARDELVRSARHELPCTLLMVDLDHFKSKNDTYGHLVGDVVLQDVARLMRDNLRGVDLMARYGGEEFVLLLIETGAEQAMAIADRLRQLVEVQPIRAYDEVLAQTVSIGVASYPEDGADLETLIERADQALYAAKRMGRNRVVRWAQTLSNPHPTRQLDRPSVVS